MKLRVILTVISMLAILSVTTAGYLYYDSLEETAYIEAEKEVALEALRIQDALSSYLSENLKSVKALAGLSELSEALKNTDRGSLEQANAILDHFTESLQADVCYLMNRHGDTIASSNREDSDSFVGANFSFRPYFELAVQGSPATYMALGITSRKRGVYYSHPVYGNGEGPPLGVAVIKSPVNLIEEEFKNEYEGTVLLTDPNGIAFISNREDWLYRSLWKLPPQQVERIAGTQQFGPGPWEWIGLTIGNRSTAVDSSGQQFMLFKMEVDNFPGWHVIYLRNLKDITGTFSGPLIRVAGPVTMVLSFLVGLSVFILYRKANHDIRKRREAEEALRGAQQELEHYSKDLERQVRERTREITSILKFTPAVVYVKDRKGRYRFINSRYEELFKVQNEEIQGKTDFDVFPKEIAEAFRENDRRVLNEGKPWPVEEQVPQEGGMRTYLSVKFPIYDESESVTGLCGISTDITDIKKAQDQLRRLSDSIIEGQEKERAAVSRELHDELGQVLTALRMDAVWLREQLRGENAAGSLRAVEMCDLIDKAIDEVRSMATRLRPGVLDDLGLIDALDWYTADFEKRTDIACNFHHKNVPPVSESLATAAYRIAQETLTNVARHSFATRVAVSLKAHDGTLTLSVADNGRGFDTRDLNETKGLGAAGMRERAILAGGALEIISRPGEGTRVIFRAPLDGKREVLH